MIMWFKGRHDDTFEFRTYSIKGDKGHFQIYKYPHSISVPDITQKVETLIETAWEMKPDYFIFICCTAQEGNRNKNFVVDIKDKGKIK